MSNTNPFGAESTLSTAAGKVKYFSLPKLIQDGIGDINTLPYSIRVLLEACLRNIDNFIVTADDVTNLANWNAASPAQVEVPFKPGRVVLQDFTGVPAIVDLAAMREAMVQLGGDPVAVMDAVRLRFPFDVDLRRSGGVGLDSDGNARFAVKGAWEALAPMVTGVRRWRNFSRNQSSPRAFRIHFREK